MQVMTEVGEKMFGGDNFMIEKRLLVSERVREESSAITVQ